MDALWGELQKILLSCLEDRLVRDRKHTTRQVDLMQHILTVGIRDMLGSCLARLLAGWDQ